MKFADLSDDIANKASFIVSEALLVAYIADKAVDYLYPD